MLITNSSLIELLAIQNAQNVMVQVALNKNNSYILVLYQTPTTWKSIKYSVLDTEYEAQEKADTLIKILNDYYEPTLLKYHVTQA